MSPARTRRRPLAALALAACFVLTGCGTGFDAATSQAYDAAVGTNVRGGEVEVHNALFVDNDDQTATLSAAFLNKSTDEQTLTAVEVLTAEGNTVETTLAEPIDLPREELYISGDTADVVIEGTNFTSGEFVEVTFTFDQAGAVSIGVPVVNRNGFYDDIAEAPATEEEEAPAEDESTEDESVEDAPADETP